LFPNLPSEGQSGSTAVTFSMAAGTSVICNSVFDDDNRLRLGKFFDNF
jgi:hypothetical protein